MKLKYKKEGITLIALVITIIVLLILAGVSIATLTGDNGILTKAQIAKEESQKASEEEQIKLAAMNAAMNKEKYDYKVEDGKVPIPAGFAPTQIEGQNSIKDGVVVVDEKCNEFVWIPVTSRENYVRNKDYESKECSEIAHDDEGYLPEGIENETTAVVNAGGFYIGRYEAGAEGGKLGETTWTEKPTLVSKKGATVYNWITQEDCKKEAKTFINNKYVKSALISGIQWDMTMAFIDGKIDGNNNTYNVTIKDTRRHTGSLAKSGQNEADKVCNIYDLEGNCFEYVAEKGNAEDSESCINRGGAFNSIEVTASGRGHFTGERAKRYSFRFVLYVM